eukprot:gene3942-4565_t
MARIVKRTRDSQSTVTLSLDDYLVGTVRTSSENSYITDSSAGASAYATGVKAVNDAVSVNKDNVAMGTIFEAAKTRGLKTGIVVTSRVTDGTPAAFYSHSVSRDSEDFILSQLWSKDVDVVMGGGGFYKDTEEEMCAKYNYNLVRNKTEMNMVKEGKILGVFASKDMSMEIDRIHEGMMDSMPSLKEMTLKALELLDRDNENGFLLMLEGSKIDTAGHVNDAAGQVYETLAFDEAFQAALDFARGDGNTLVIATADHETGGLTLGIHSPDIRPMAEYQWRPSVLLNATASIKKISKIIASQCNSTTSILDNGNVIKDVVQSYTGLELTSAHIDLLANFTTNGADLNYTLPWQLGSVLSSFANIGWTTPGHTGVDVNLYYADFSETDVDPPSANIENTDIAKLIAKILNLDLAFETSKLVSFNTTG